MSCGQQLSLWKASGNQDTRLVGDLCRRMQTSEGDFMLGIHGYRDVEADEEEG